MCTYIHGCIFLHIHGLLLESAGRRQGEGEKVALVQGSPRVCLHVLYMVIGDAGLALTSRYAPAIMFRESEKREETRRRLKKKKKEKENKGGERGAICNFREPISSSG